MNEAGVVGQERRPRPRTTWSFPRIWSLAIVIVTTCVCQIWAAVPFDIGSGNRSTDSFLLDFTGADGCPTTVVELFGRKFKVNGEFLELASLVISVRAGVDSSDYKMLLNLENMACYGNEGVHVWIEDSSGHSKTYCHTSPIHSILLEGQREIRIGIGPDWGTGLTAHVAAIRATAYYEPARFCECDNKGTFCCQPCPPRRSSATRDAQNGYCMNKTMAGCDYSKFCPCLPGEEPDPVECPVDDGVDSPAVAFYLMILFITTGIILAAGIIFCLPFFCFRRKPPVAAPTQSRDRARRNTPDPPPSWRPEFDNPPPPYEAPSEEYTLKQVKICDLMDEEEPPPPPYEAVVSKN